MNDVDGRSALVQDVVCPRCSCMCDDLEVAHDRGRFVQVRGACALGESWFLQSAAAAGPSCLIDGQPAAREDGLSRAAELLAAARHPLFYGFREASCEALCAAADLAEALGGTIDTAVAAGHAASLMAFHAVGKSSCTLGEIRNRSDLVICWGSDPAEHHPRLYERSIDIAGRFLPAGRRERTFVVVDVRPTATSATADLFLQIQPDSDFDALWALRGLAAGQEIAADRVFAQTGLRLEQLHELYDRMCRAQYGSILFGMGLMLSRGRHLNCQAVMELVRQLNRTTRFVCRSARGRGNVTGADNALCWRTGYPFGVNLARGYPRYNPGEYTAEDLLARQEADAALVVASFPHAEFSRAALVGLRRIPSVFVGPEYVDWGATPHVQFRTSTYGLHSGGTVYRMDEVPLPLRPALSSALPSECDVLQGLGRRLPSAKVPATRGPSI